MKLPHVLQVIGWGLTASGGKQSEELKELSVPYVPDGECLQNLREDFKPYFTVDKMCSGYLQNGKSNKKFKNPLIEFRFFKRFKCM